MKTKFEKIFNLKSIKQQKLKGESIPFQDKHIIYEQSFIRFIKSKNFTYIEDVDRGNK